MSKEEVRFGSFTVKLPLAVVERILGDIEGTSFTGVADFIESMILQKFPELQKPVYTKEEEELIKARLRRLGYIE